MKWLTLIILIILVQAASALNIPPRTNITIQPHCYNASGTFYGSEANLTVRNESGVYFVNDDITNVGTGAFAINLTNLTAGHCYTLELGCEDAEAVTNEHGTICVDKEEENNMLAAIILLPLLFVALIFLSAFLIDPVEHKLLRLSLMPLSFVGFIISTGYAATSISRIYGWRDVSNSLSDYSVWALGIGVILTVYLIFCVIKSMMEKPGEEIDDQNKR